MMTRSTISTRSSTDGWNRHDVDFLMTFMADDCVFEGASGADVVRHALRRAASACARPSPGCSRPSRTLAFARRAPRRGRRPRRVGVGLHGHGGRRPEGRGQRLRPVHVPRGQDRDEELVLQESHGVKAGAGQGGESSLSGSSSTAHAFCSSGLADGSAQFATWRRRPHA